MLYYIMHILFYTILYYAVLCYTTLYYDILYFTTLYYTPWCSSHFPNNFLPHGVQRMVKQIKVNKGDCFKCCSAVYLLPFDLSWHVWTRPSTVLLLTTYLTLGSLSRRRGTETEPFLYAPFLVISERHWRDVIVRKMIRGTFSTRRPGREARPF